MPCSVCGKDGHNRSTCPHAAGRQPFSNTPKSRRCQCCGRYGHDISRHHTRGRGDASDYLDLCKDCHLYCGHNGYFLNLPIKPQVCRVTGQISYWRS